MVLEGLLMAANKPKNAQKIPAMDVCQTPPYALEPLYPYIPKHWTIWESAAGPEELLATALREHGYIVHATDLLYGECYDRFKYKSPEYDIELTNVPFSIKYEWLAQSFSDGKRFALLVPYETTFAGKFQELFKQYNGKPWHIEVLSPTSRIDFKMPELGWGDYKEDKKTGKLKWVDSSSQMPTVWLTWGLEVHESKNIDDVLFTYYVPINKKKYNKDNTERIK